MKINKKIPQPDIHDDISAEFKVFKKKHTIKSRTPHMGNDSVQSQIWLLQSINAMQCRIPGAYILFDLIYVSGGP